MASESQPLFSLLESTYQTALEQVLGGTHKRLGVYGISDITTDEFHAEIKGAYS